MKSLIYVVFRAESVTAESKDFWIMVKALKLFIKHEGNGYVHVFGVLTV